MNPQSKPPLADSPWLWAAVFLGFSLALLILFEPRYAQRQLKIEQNSQGRMRVAERMAGQEMQTEVSSPGNLVISLHPLKLMFGLAVIAVSVAGVWRYLHRAGARRHPASEVDDVSLRETATQEVQEGDKPPQAAVASSTASPNTHSFLD